MDGEEPSQEVVDLGIVNCPTDGPVLLRRDLTTGVIKPLAACVYRARVVAGSTHEYRFRIAENED